jgi:hypothetical protein
MSVKSHTYSFEAWLPAARTRVAFGIKDAEMGMPENPEPPMMNWVELEPDELNGMFCAGASLTLRVAVDCAGSAESTTVQTAEHDESD